MKNIAYLCCFLWSIGSLSAQNILRSDTLLIPFRLEVADDAFTARLLTDKLLYKSRFNPLLAIKDLKLTDADLQLLYEQMELDDVVRYRDKVVVLSSKGELTLLNFEKPILENEARKPWKSKRIDFLDATESNLVLNEEYTIAFTADFLSSQLDCGQKPSFGLEKMWPHYAGALAGLGLIATGQSFRSRSDEAYAQYQQQWEDGAPYSPANAYLANAQKDHRTYKDLTIAGLAVLGVDAAWLFLFRLPKHLRQVRLYKKYCSDDQVVNLDVRPAIHLTEQRPQMNFLLTLNF